MSRGYKNIIKLRDKAYGNERRENLSRRWMDVFKRRC